MEHRGGAYSRGYFGSNHDLPMHYSFWRAVRACREEVRPSSELWVKFGDEASQARLARLTGSTRPRRSA
jgi:hypothetical protein